MEQSEGVSRRDEIRALFIFGLLAVFATIRVQYSQLMITLRFGSLDLVLVLDWLLVLWSMYAFFMVIGLSADVVGKTAANTFRDNSKIFLQLSFFLSAFFAFAFGLIAYGARIILFVLLITTVVAISVVVLSKKSVSLKKWLKSFGRNRKPYNLRKWLRLGLGLAFLLSALVMSSYSETGFASDKVILTAFIISVITVAAFIWLREPEKENTYSDYDYA